MVASDLARCAASLASGRLARMDPVRRLAGVGLVYIGGWTDSDGPNTEALVGILGIPASIVGVWLTPRVLRRSVGAER